MEQKIEIKANDESLKGRYSNMAQVVHNKEEFVFDFFDCTPFGATHVENHYESGSCKKICKCHFGKY